MSSPDIRYYHYLQNFILLENVAVTMNFPYEVGFCSITHRVTGHNSSFSSCCRNFIQELHHNPLSLNKNELNVILKAFFAI